MGASAPRYYGVAAAGSDWTEIHVRDVETGKDTEDVLKWIKFSGASWTKDSGGFFYSRYPEPKVNAGETFAELANQRLYYHKLASPQSAGIGSSRKSRINQNGSSAARPRRMDVTWSSTWVAVTPTIT